MAGTRAVDPDAVLDIICVHSANGAFSLSTNPTLPNGSRVDIGNYDHVALIVTNVGGTASTPIVVTPRESDSQTGPEFPLDGTNGAPNFSFQFASAALTGTNISRQRTIPVAGRRRYLNLVVAVPASGTFRPTAYLIGVGKRANTGRLVNTDLAQVGPIA